MSPHSSPWCCFLVIYSILHRQQLTYSTVTRTSPLQRLVQSRQVFLVVQILSIKSLVGPFMERGGSMLCVVAVGSKPASVFSGTDFEH